MRDEGPLNVTVSPDALKEMQRADKAGDSSPELRKLVERLKDASGKKGEDVSVETIADEIKAMARSADGAVSQVGRLNPSAQRQSRRSLQRTPAARLVHSASRAR